MRATCYLLALLTVLAVGHVAGDKYTIKGRDLTNLPDALRELRMFIKDSTKLNEKCERYGSLLRAFKRYTLNSFWIADLALKDHNDLEKSFRTVDVEALRRYYIEAIETYLAGTAEKPMLDLHDCLEAQYSSRDTEAMRFLNRQDVRDAVDQYRSFLKLPMSFYLGNQAKHPTLAREDLHPAVVDAVLKLFNGDIVRFESHFLPRQAIQGNVSPQQQQVVVQADPRQEAAAFAVAQSGSIREELSLEEKQYVDRIVGSLLRLYNTLPERTSAGNRCDAYSRVIQADPSRLSDVLVQDLVSEFAKRSADRQAASYVFSPQENVRTNFMLTLNLMDPEVSGLGVWSDMMNCVGKWAASDPSARAFLEDPTRKRLMDEVAAASAPLQQPPQPQPPRQPIARPPVVAPAPVPVVPEPLKPAPTQQVAPPQVQPRPEPAPVPVPVPQPPTVPQQPQQTQQQQPIPAEPALGLAETQKALKPEEREYLNKVFRTLSSVYQTLPLEAKLNDRCKVYNSVIAAEPGKLGVGLAEILVKELGERLAIKQTQQGEAFKPTGAALNNFLFSLSVMDPKENDYAAIWLDMMDCVSQWQQGDQLVQSFVSQPERQALKADILHAIEQ